MKCEVISLEARRGGALTVRTLMGNVLAIFPYTDPETPPKNENGELVGRKTYYPIRLGYASTVHQHQGAELKHVPSVASSADSLSKWEINNQCNIMPHVMHVLPW